MMIVFTKTNLSAEKIKDRILSKLIPEQRSSMDTERAKWLLTLEDIVQNDRFAVFPMPEAKGIVDKSISTPIMTTLESLQFIPKPKVNRTVSSSSFQKLIQLANELNAQNGKSCKELN